jgi:hypothetical protein
MEFLVQSFKTIELNNKECYLMQKKEFDKEIEEFENMWERIMKDDYFTKNQRKYINKKMKKQYENLMIKYKDIDNY